MHPAATRGRILVVDDDESMCALLKTALRSHGFDVRCAADGLRALERVEEFHPQVVVSDLMMPGLNGLGLLKALASQLPDIRFVLITGHPTVDEAVQAIACGACDVLLKPLDLDALAELMGELTTERRHTPRRASCPGVPAIQEAPR